MYRYLLILFMLAAASGADALTLTVDNCIAIAFSSHPSLVSAAASVSADLGRLKSAAVAERVTVNGTMSTGRSGADDKAASSSFSVGASLSYRLFDSGRTRYQVEARRRTLDSTIESAEQARRSVRSGVKSAYTDLVLYQQAAVAREEAVRAYEEHLASARGFYDAGSRPWYDVTKAEVDLGNARLDLVTAQLNVINGRASLLHAMGLTDVDEEFDVVPVEWALADGPMEGAAEISPAYWELSSAGEDAAVAAALENRADYIASSHSVEASRASLAAAAREASPVISLSGGFSGSGSHPGNLGEGWNGGLSMSVPIVDGGSHAASIETSRAALASAEASHEALRQKIVLEVRNALSALRTARERTKISELTVTNAEENYRLAVGRYETGVGDALEVADALVARASAHLARHQAKNAAEAAVIKLEDAIGLELAR